MFLWCARNLALGWSGAEGRTALRPKSTSPVTAASSTGRCNTIYRVYSAMLAREKHLFGCTRSKPSHSSVPAGLILAGEFGICFQCQAGSSLVLRRPIEITRVTGHLLFDPISLVLRLTRDSTLLVLLGEGRRFRMLRMSESRSDKLFDSGGDFRAAWFLSSR